MSLRRRSRYSRRVCAWLVVLSCGSSAVFAQSEDVASPSTTVSETSNVASSSATEIDSITPSILLKGTVWRTKPGIVFLKTPIGLLTLSSKTTLKDLKASQEVTFAIHGPHMAVDIRRRSDGALVHRYLTGPFRPPDGATKTLPRWTPEGEQSFHYGTYEQAFAVRRDGDPITVEVDQSGTVAGLHDLQFDLQIGQLPTGGSDAHLRLAGTVSKLKSSFIFFRTPIGVVNVNAKLGIKHAKVGHTLTLHIHRDHMVADLSASGATAPGQRFVTGPLQFATPERTSVRLWTPEGERIYSTERGKSALAGVKEGHLITVELNGRGGVVDFHRFN